MVRERTEGGHFEQQYSRDAVLDAFGEVAVPVLTSTEVAAEVGCSRDTARVRLEELVDEDELYRKEVGARAVVYIFPPDGRLTGYGEWKRSLWTDE